jgi:hypothetical protein
MRRAANASNCSFESQTRLTFILSPKPKKTKKAPEWKSLPDAEKAQYLLDHQTISDRTWTDEPRLKDEKRDAFIRRISKTP